MTRGRTASADVSLMVLQRERLFSLPTMKIEDTSFSGYPSVELSEEWLDDKDSANNLFKMDTALSLLDDEALRSLRFWRYADEVDMMKKSAQPMGAYVVG